MRWPKNYESLPRGSSASPPITISSREWYIQSWARGPRAIFHERVFTPIEPRAILPSLSLLTYPAKVFDIIEISKAPGTRCNFVPSLFLSSSSGSPCSRSVLLSAPLFALLVCNPLFLMLPSHPSFRVRSEYRDVARNRKERRQGEGEWESLWSRVI